MFLNKMMYFSHFIKALCVQNKLASQMKEPQAHSLTQYDKNKIQEVD